MFSEFMEILYEGEERSTGPFELECAWKIRTVILAHSHIDLKRQSIDGYATMWFAMMQSFSTLPPEGEPSLLKRYVLAYRVKATI
jgi:hypothetical protein